MSEPGDEVRLAQVDERTAGARLDRVVSSLWPDITRSRAKRLIQQGLVLLNAAPARPAVQLKAGDELEVNLPRVPDFHAYPEPLPLDIVYEDDDLLVVNKPSGLVVHPAPGHPNGTLVNGLLWHAAELAGTGPDFRPGLVHRLDKGTSGLLVVAKREAAQADLQKQIQRRSAHRRYLALVWGRPKWDEYTVDAPLARHPRDRKKFAVSLKGRPAVTELEVRGRFRAISLLEARLQTGRTHQIRVHCTHLGHPVVGDPVYGVNPPGRANLGRPQVEFQRLHKALPGQALHAWHLSFDHPRTGERLTFEAPLPEPFANLLEFLQNLD